MSIIESIQLLYESQIQCTSKNLKQTCLVLEVPEYSPVVASTFCSLNIHCIFSTKERVPMLNPELRERLWPFLGGIAKQNGIMPRCIGGVSVSKAA